MTRPSPDTNAPPLRRGIWIAAAAVLALVVVAAFASGALGDFAAGFGDGLHGRPQETTAAK